MNCSSYTSGPALIIGAASVTVNLNSHEILGPGAGADTEGIVDFSSDGAAGAPFAGLIVENGSISNFSTDVDVEGSSGTPLTGIVVENVKTTNKAFTEGYAFYGEYLTSASIHNDSVSDANVGIELYYSTSSTVSDNTMVRPGTDGFFDDVGAGNSWSHNWVSAATGDGFDLRSTTDDIVESNTVTGSGSANGIYDDESLGVTISKNVLNGLYDGVYEDYENESGTVSHNTGSHDQWGIYSYEPAGMTFQGNKFNRGQLGIETDYPYSETLEGNTTNNNSEAGVLIYTDEEVSSYTPEVKNNTADNNRYGLYSQISTTGNGNDATGNTVVNCYNVHCGSAGPRAGSVAAPVHRTPRGVQANSARQARF